MSSDSTRAELAVQRRDFVDARAVQLGLLDEPGAEVGQRSDERVELVQRVLDVELRGTPPRPTWRARFSAGGPGSQLWSFPRAAREQSEGLTGETGFPP